MCGGGKWGENVMLCLALSARMVESGRVLEATHTVQVNEKFL